MFVLRRRVGGGGGCNIGVNDDDDDAGFGSENWCFVFNGEFDYGVGGDDDNSILCLFRR